MYIVRHNSSVISQPHTAIYFLIHALYVRCCRVPHDCNYYTKLSVGRNWLLEVSAHNKCIVEAVLLSKKKKKKQYLLCHVLPRFPSLILFCLRNLATHVFLLPKESPFYHVFLDRCPFPRSFDHQSFPFSRLSTKVRLL